MNITELLLKVIIILYASVGVIGVIGFFPTIKDLLLKKKSANVHSYVIWTFCSGVSFLYAFLIIKDLLFEVVTGLLFACSFITLILSLKLKYE